MQFETHCQEYIQQVYSVIQQELEIQGRGLPVHLREVTESYLKRPGKYLRPVLVLLCCEIAGGKIQDALPVAAAAEMFHNWTLLHDDVIDHDILRRNQPTGHIQGAALGRNNFSLNHDDAADYGQSLAILAGDVLQGQVVHLIASAKDIPLETRLKIIELLAGRLNPELLAGEQMDVDMACRPVETISEEEILEMYRLKTGALLGFCAEAGTLMGTISPRNQELPSKLRRFAEACGIAFQLQDDLLGLTGNEAVFGKDIGSDLREGKRTFILANAWKNCNATQKAELSAVIGNHHATHEQLERAITLIRECGAIEKASELATSCLSEALNILSNAVPEHSIPVECLEEWARRLLKRNK